MEAASDDPTLKQVVDDNGSETTTTICAKDVDVVSAESSVTMSVLDLTRASVDAFAVDITPSAVGHIDGTDGDSGIGSPLRNVSSGLPEDENKMF